MIRRRVVVERTRYGYRRRLVVDDFDDGPVRCPVCRFPDAGKRRGQTAQCAACGKDVKFR